MSDFWAILESISTAVAALAAAGAVIYAIRQYGQSEKARTEGRAAELEASQARARAERLHEKSLQPYVVATPVPEQTWGRELVLRIENFGPTAAHDLQVTFPNELVVVTKRRNTYDQGYGAREALVLATTVLAPGQSITEPAPLFEADRDADALSIEVCVSYKDPAGRQLENRYTMTFAEAARLQPDPMTDAVQKISETMAKWSGPGDQASLTVESRQARHQRLFEHTPRSHQSGPPNPSTSA